ncbi:DUF3313 domain-containing protein [Photobacterium sagamiensis]|uniref:DUF3313 domain-containing protein n=1 Tax=Photobacterium sagamiensis TaxID=2910241 RepID=UPI003D0B4DCF
MLVNFDDIYNALYQKMKFLSVMFFCVMVAACTSKTVEKEKYSGFLSDYSQLEKVTVSSGEASIPVLGWKSPTLTEHNYSKIMIDPIVLYPAPQPGEQISSEVLTSINAYLNNAVREEVGKKYEIVDKPGKDVIHLRAAITGVTATPEDLAAYEYIPVTFVLAEASTAAGKRDEMVQLFSEAEFSDSLSGERLAAGVRKGFGKPLESQKDQVELEHVRPLLDDLAQTVVHFLDATLK